MLMGALVLNLSITVKRYQLARAIKSMIIVQIPVLLPAPMPFLGPMCVSSGLIIVWKDVFALPTSPLLWMKLGHVWWIGQNVLLQHPSWKGSPPLRLLQR